MDGIELMAEAMHAARARLDVAASNLANVSSAAFSRHVAHTSLDARGISFWSAPDPAQGPLERTGRDFDLAIAGRGGFFVREPSGSVGARRSGSFVLDAGGRLVDERGSVLLGEHGPVRVRAGAVIDARGAVRDLAGRELGRIRLIGGSSVQSGFLERSNVDAIHEMVDILAAQRAFETAQSSLAAIDGVRAKGVNDVGRVKA